MSLILSLAREMDVWMIHAGMGMTRFCRDPTVSAVAMQARRLEVMGAPMSKEALPNI